MFPVSELTESTLSGSTPSHPFSLKAVILVVITPLIAVRQVGSCKLSQYSFHPSSLLADEEQVLDEVEYVDSLPQKQESGIDERSLLYRNE